MEKPSRRAVVVLFALGLAACGGADDDAREPPFARDAGGSGEDARADGGPDAPSDAQAEAAEASDDARADADGDAALLDADDAGDAPDDAPPASGCSLVGAWTVTVTRGVYAGVMGSFVAAADGTWSGAFGSTQLAGTWLVDAFDVLRTLDTCASAECCPSSQIGRYQLVWSAGCAVVDWEALADPCSARLEISDGFHLERE